MSSPPFRMCPIFQISNVTGENLDLLKMFLNLLSPRTSYREEEPAEFQIDDTYSVPVSASGWLALPALSSVNESVMGISLIGWGLLLGRVWGQWCPGPR